MQAELLKLIENFDVISFDVFDTLLVRSYLGQEDLWRDVEKVEKRGGGGQWSDCFLKALRPTTRGLQKVSQLCYNSRCS